MSMNAERSRWPIVIWFYSADIAVLRNIVIHMGSCYKKVQSGIGREAVHTPIALHAYNGRYKHQNGWQRVIIWWTRACGARHVHSHANITHMKRSCPLTQSRWPSYVVLSALSPYGARVSDTPRVYITALTWHVAFSGHKSLHVQFSFNDAIQSILY